MCWTVFILTLCLCSYMCHGYYNNYYNTPGLNAIDGGQLDRICMVPKPVRGVVEEGMAILELCPYDTGAPIIAHILSNGKERGIAVGDHELSHLDDFSDENALAVFKNIQKKSYRKRLICRRWNHHCVPWSHKAGFKCCSDLSCKCNLWMQNCRCVSKLWGK